MMNSNAAARKRRAPPPEIPSQLTSRQVPSAAGPAGTVPSNALTLQQVIHVVDKRLIALETFMKETKTTNDSKSPSEQAVSGDSGSSSTVSDVMLQNIIQEFTARFDILAEELGNLKDTVLKLQTYTMDVNKMLVDERIHILSDIGGSNQPVGNLTVTENIKLEEMSVSTVELTDEIQNS